MQQLRFGSGISALCQLRRIGRRGRALRELARILRGRALRELARILLGGHDARSRVGRVAGRLCDRHRTTKVVMPDAADAASSETEVRCGQAREPQTRKHTVDTTKAHNVRRGSGSAASELHSIISAPRDRCFDVREELLNRLIAAETCRAETRWTTRRDQKLRRSDADFSQLDVPRRSRARREARRRGHSGRRGPVPISDARMARGD